ncbi:uncharacterized protein Z518_10122 [Rhinocladiella mackenziei CBS 650.93]|uniref:Rhinocladiella mackenziei CBS 650.93 unplaced genomic scaffold supercont1.8, whole genome shotgun sequence n=1 Tax=Rhinocladiella mackenziei CBS 650.93 TaxID=1442369 RepID=A0A0D2ICU9_9EURO|nr:uncharacterized protein Z518_10122 [Rhinocladiella mackenziei CBS 650.93]KIX01056.1 hypothetical protein Z518_10122 [Rhinocladiella mackenziei CBS 650.93]
MDPSTDPSTHNQSYGFLDGIQAYSNSDNLQNGEDYSQYFDPALFENTTIGQSFSQQPQSISQNFDSNIPRQSNSPGIQQYTSAQPTYSHQQYSQSLYDSRQLSQPNYDPRFYPRHSPSPVGFDGGYPYQSPMGYPNQNYNSQHMNMPPRQDHTPTPNYPPRQQHPSPYVNIGPRPSQLSQVQNADMMHFGNFPEQNHQPSSAFVDPSMLTGNQMINANNNNSNFPAHQQYMPPSYFKAGSTVDPRSLQGVQPLQPMPTASSQSPHPGKTIIQSCHSNLTNSAPAVQPKPEKIAKSKTPKDPHAPRKSKTKTKKDVAADTKTEEQASDSESSSDDELSFEDEDPPEMTPTLLTVSAPTDERGKALYSSVQAVWAPRNRPAPPEKIRNGIAGFGDTVRSLRDAWKVKNDSLRKAEIPNSPTASDAARLKDEVARYRTVMESVMARSNMYGHPAIVKRLGENQFTMSALYSFMLDRFNAGDYDSPLVSAILEFVVKFETLDTEMLEMTKLSKILQRFTKRASSEIKTMAQTILDNAAAASAKKASAAAAENKSDKPASPKSTGSPADGARKEVVTGMKRPREGDSSSQSAPKKVVKVIAQSSKPLALQNAERRKALETAKTGEKSATTTTATTSTANAAGKAKVAVTAPPKSASFSSLMSASKKPGTSLAARAAAAAKDKTTTGPSAGSTPSSKKENARKESPPRNVSSAPVAKTASSFLGLLADMEKKPEKEAKKETEIPNETEEQRAKRLRKEARRKLRVSWKADAELVETRLFTHDPEEEIGHGDSMRRDAGDTGREGEALKLHKDMEELEEEEEEEEDSFEELEPYSPPSEVDFSVLKDETDSLSINSIKYGGTVKPESPSSEKQNKHEQDTVMATYASKADRPSTPKEPDDSMEDEGDFEPAEPETPFGEPNETTRRREKEYLARQAQKQPTPNTMPTRTDLATQVQAMSAVQTPQQQSTGVSPELQRVLSMLQQQNQSTPPPQAAPASNVNLQALLQTVQQVTQQFQGQNQPPQYQAPAQNTAISANLSALLASMQQSSQAQPAPLPIGLSNNPNPYPGAIDDSSRKHARADSNDYDNDYSRKGGNKKKKGGVSGDQPKPYNYKTQICSFWEQGKCIKGDACTYRHGDE